MSEPRRDRPVSRRGFLALTLLGAPAVLAACGAVVSDPRPSPTPSPTPTPAAARGGGGRPYGPDGSHWPAHSPHIDDPDLTVVEVACDWTAIGAALAAITPERAAAGTVIAVAPGTLGGFGTSTGSDPVLEDLGRADWERNVVVAPREGWGTVTIAEPARLLGVRGVTFARIDGTTVLLTNCSRTAWAQAKMADGLKMTSSYGETTRGCGAYEIVMSTPKADIHDPLGYAAGEGCTLIDCVWEGCYCAPVFRPLGASDHVDTLQMYGTGWYRGLTVRDSTLFGSLNCALQLGGVRDDDPNRGTPFLTIDHSVITSQATAIRVRYPVPDGAESPDLEQAINGVGEAGQLHAADSYLFGTLYRTSWGTVSNTKVSYEKAGERNPIVQGRWDYDPGMRDWGPAEFDALTPAPTDEFLAAAWA